MNSQKKYSSIVFFGPDASGKSTQVKLLTSYLNKKGLKTRKVWIRAHHSFAFLILKFLFKADLDQDPLLKTPRIQSMISKSKIWLLVEFTSILPWILLRFYLPRLFGYIIICDRYIPDTLVSLSYAYGDTRIISRFPMNFLFRSIPRNSLFFSFTGDTTCLKNRSKEGYFVKNSIEFQKKVYSLLAYSLNANVIDTSIFDTNETFKKVLIKLNEPLAQTTCLQSPVSKC